MRTLPLVLLALSLPACKKSAPPAQVVVVPVAAPEAQDLAPAAPPPEVAPERAPVPTRSSPPSNEEVKQLLKPLFKGFGQCIYRANSSATRTDFLLRFTIQPSGAIKEPEIGSLPDATPCLNELFETVRAEPWNGNGTIIDVPLQKSGEPVWVTVKRDGGS